MVDQPLPPGVDFVWDQAERRLDAQMKQADALDSKTGALVALHALAAGLISSTVGRLTGSARWVAFGAIAGLVISGAVALGGYRTEAYDRRPAPEELWRFGGWTDREIRYRFLSTRFQALAVNRKRLERKARLISVSLAGLAVLALAVSISAMIGLART